MTKFGPKNAPPRPNAFGYLLIFALIGTAFSLFSGQQTFFEEKITTEISISEMQEKYRNDELKIVQLKDNLILAESFDSQKFSAVKDPNANLIELGFNDSTRRAKIEVIDTSGSKFWTNLLIGVAPFLFLILFFVFLARRSGGMGGDGGPFGFGKSRAKTYDKEKHKTKFADVAGVEEAKEEVFEIVDFLKNPKKYHAAGAKIPKGILLLGPPGTGKTLLARAIAGEAEVPFFSVSGSEFVEMFVGVGASRVRDLFQTAKRNAPAIIFIDEVDAIGKQRGAGGSGGHDEREQTLNQILTEMDGFEPTTSVIVIAATNRADVLDKALLRPGRFDRRVMIDLPDMDAREKILKLHAKNKKLVAGTDLRKVASKTVGFSGADIENVLNEAAIAAVKRRKKKISASDLENAVEKVAMGPERRSRRISQKEREIIAHHEVGHAIAGHFTENCEPVEKISIISRGRALGATWFLPVEDTYLNSEQKMFDEMVSLHGGRIAERLIFGQTTTGASNDLERISQIARSMIMTYGMGSEKVGAVVFATRANGWAGVEWQERDFSPETARLIDLEVQELVEKSEKIAKKTLSRHKNLLKKIASDLLEKETIGREEFLGYFGVKSRSRNDKTNEMKQKNERKN